MKIDGNSLKPGIVIEHLNRLWRVVKTQHVKPGKGGAFMQVELKEIPNGTKMNERFRSSEMIEKVRLEQMDYQYLYGDGESFTFMEQTNYEQIILNKDDLDENQISYLQDGMIVMIETYEGRPIGVKIPEQVVLEVVEADAVIKGQTAASSYKPAIMANGVKILVPPYIVAGEKIVVNTTESVFVERFKG